MLILKMSNKIIMTRNYFKTLVIAAFLVGIATSSFAQMQVGARLGVNLANLRGSSIQNNSMLVGYNVGVSFDYGFKHVIKSDFGERFSVGIEVAASQKGATTDYLFYHDTIPSSPIDTVEGAKQVSTYVEIPILAKYNFGDPKNIHYYVEAGFYVASLFGLTINDDVWRDHDQDASTDRRKYREEYTGFDYGAIVGGGVLIPIGGRRSPWLISGDIRYTIGLTNVGELKKGTTDIPPEQLEDIKTSALSILVGVVYKLNN